MTQQTRFYIYGIIAALGALVVGYGLITGDQLALWLALAAAALGSGGNVLAQHYSSPKRFDVEPAGRRAATQPARISVADRAELSAVAAALTEGDPAREALARLGVTPTPGPSEAA